MEIRPADPAQAPVLSELALRSKAVWGYDQSFMEQCRRELTVSRDYVQQHLVYVAQEGLDPHLLGFYTLRREGPLALLDYLYVDPFSLRQGIGRRLWQHAVATARAEGACRLIIDADPHAEAFYTLMGARRMGFTPSGSIPGRMLPQMALELSGGEL